MKSSNAVLALVVLLVAISATALAERNNNCDLQRLTDDPDRFDVHCDCKQRLSPDSYKINKLTIDQTGCSEKALELTWSELESKVAPDKLVLVGALVHITPNVTKEPWTPSIRVLEFVDCNITELPEHAFRGMGHLKEVRLIRSTVDVINSDAFSNLSELQLVEVANSTITMIKDHAFNNLPALEDLAFGYSFIGSFDSGAISLKPSQEAARERCGSVGRSMEEPKEMIDAIMGRELSSFGNVSLPEYGTRFTLYKNNIITINSGAISTETLGFLIVGGNHILTVESEAFDMELYNECEISAALIVGNTIDNLSSWALKGLRGKDGASYQAFLALANNTFINVFDQSFLVSNNLVVFAVEENQFGCTCDNTGWVVKRPNTLEKEIIEKGVCLNGFDLIAFTDSCNDVGNSVITTAASVQTTTGLPSSVTTETSVTDSASAVSYTASLVAAVVITTLYM
ncbi:leucine-rich repeat and immunoglobulin-like domain-containing nogo receptor-interacting protein 3 [Palaemon carinicauda]|uniref:leucine-rich repeat and immunoglobulin-like domain-containing nogo receptor-interacting protein 3 n=1 Tax=Palaemon carinicauda TaxID=392227 RepID=UPI0035B64D9F